MSAAKQQMIDTMFIAGELTDGTPIYTMNPEDAADQEAVWEESDFPEIKAWMDELQDKLDNLRTAFNRQLAGCKKYCSLSRQMKEVDWAWKDLKSEISRKTLFCSREKLDYPAIDYMPEPLPEKSGDTLSTRGSKKPLPRNIWEQERREEVATNKDLERKESV